MATVRLWPARKDDGSAILVYASDGVTVIPLGGALITLVAGPDGRDTLPDYYVNLIIDGLLLNRDPDGNGGDPIVIPPDTEAGFAERAGAINGLLVSELSSTPLPASASDDLTVAVLCSGYARMGDDGGGVWGGVRGGQAVYTEDTWSVRFITGTTDCWVKELNGNKVNVCSFGAFYDGSVDAVALVNQFMLDFQAKCPQQAEGLTLYWPSIRPRQHLITTNSTAVVQVASTVGIRAGTFVTASQVPSGTYILTVDSATQFTMSADATATGPRKANISAYGYRSSTAALFVPIGMQVKFEGECKPYIDTFLPGDSSQHTRISGPVIRADANVGGFGRWPDPNTYAFAHLENLGFLGPGSTYTTATGVDTFLFNAYFSMKDCAIAGFREGLWVRGCVSLHAIDRVVVKGCNWGYALGGQHSDYSTAELTDTEFNSCDAQYCNVAWQFNNAATIRIAGGLVQSVRDGLIFGQPDGTGANNNIDVQFSHVEGVGDDNAFYLALNPGGCHVVIHPSPCAGITFRKTKFVGDQADAKGATRTLTPSMGSQLYLCTDTSGLYLGQRVAALDGFGTLPGGAVIQSIVANTSVTLSKPALNATLIAVAVFHRSRTLFVPPGARITWDDCFMPGRLVLGQNGNADLKGPGRSCGFEDMYFHHQARPVFNNQGTGREAGDRAGTISGTYTPNWAMDGPDNFLAVGGAVTINKPLYGTYVVGLTKLNFDFQQVGAGGYAVSWAAGYDFSAGAAWNNTGNVASACAQIGWAINGNLNYFVKTPQPTFAAGAGWKI